jgi:hypothetical protein
MSLGALAFLNPWLLAALASLPLIYWLLRTVPPRPKQIEFPPTRILVGLENREKTPAKTPWWLMLIRLLAAALVIFALAEPILNPTQNEALKGTGPVVIAVDNGWSSGPRWGEHLEMVDRLIGEAEGQSRPVVLVETAAAGKTTVAKIEAPNAARSTAAALQPQPFAPDRKAALTALEAAMKDTTDKSISIVWLTDGIDHGNDAAVFAEGLAGLASQGTFTVVRDVAGKEPLGGIAGVGKDGKLTMKVMRSGGPIRAGTAYAFSARGQRLGEASFTLSANATQTEFSFNLPLELRNQVTRVEIGSERSAGAVSLIDSRSQWQRVGLISGESQEQSQPLLAPLYYIEKAVAPFSEIVRPRDQNLAAGVDTVIKQGASVMVLADIGTLSGDVRDQVDDWVNKGGVLVRFAGPRLEKGGDDLLPVALREGGRTLGGALSWSTPQPLNAFEDTSLFAGLTVPGEVAVTRQVLADPARLTPEVKVWARLKDGTPLVTAHKRGEGEIVLFHITANSDWSNLPISGLFVEMLRRITALGNAGGIAQAGDATTTADTAEGSDTAVAATPQALPPVETLDGFGLLKPPPPTAQAIPIAKANAMRPSVDHPPGYYGKAGRPRALNVLQGEDKVAPLPSLPSSATQSAYEARSTMPLKPWLLAAALALLFADIIAVLILQTGMSLRGMRRAAPRAAAIAMVAGLAAGASVGSPPAAFAQDSESSSLRTPDDELARKATEKVTLGYVMTGDADADNTSRLGLSGLGKILKVKTAVEPGEPIGVDILHDEIAFYPMLYWPVLPDAKALPAPVLAKIDAYMKQGGLIVFDTKDYGNGLPSGMPMSGTSGPALQRLLGSLDIPRLEPVPEDHVLTKAFYLLRSFPGRWDGGQLWVEAQSGDSGGGSEEGRKARRADGVTSIMITSNDFASAWALDERGRPIYPVVPGGENQREMALRTGVNIVMHALTGNYKADQVHVPALLERLGQ